MTRPTRENTFSREDVDFVTGLLTLCPSDLDIERITVFTTSPWIWEWSGHKDDLEIVDVGPLFGVSGSLSPDGRQVTGHVIDQLAAAGWDRTLIQTEYRPSQKSSDRLDIACLNPTGDEVMLAVEVTSSSRFGPEVFQQASSYCNRNGFDRMLVSDGFIFGFVDAEGNFEEINGIPTPNGEIAGRSANCHIVCSSIEQLDEILVENAQSVLAIVDLTIPWMGRAIWRQFERTPALSAMEQRLASSFQNGQLVDLFAGYLVHSPAVQFVNAILPTVFSISSTTRPFRDFVATTLAPISIVHLNQVRQLDAAISALFVQLGKVRNTTYFADTNEQLRSRSLDDQTWFQSLKLWMQNEVPELGFCASLDANNDWSAAKHDPAVSELRSRLERLGEVKLLDEVAEILQGRHVPSPDSVEDDGVPIVTGRCIHGGVVDLADARQANPQSLSDPVWLEKSDLLLPQIWSHSPSVAIFRENCEAVAHESVLVVRAKPELISPEYLREYLNSPSAMRLIESSASTMGSHMRTSRRELAQTPVPMDSDFSDEFRHIESAMDELDEMREQLNGLRTQLFDAKDKRDFRNRVSKVKHLARLVTLSVSSVSDTNFQITNYYPYPIAYGYRLLNGITNPIELYKHQLRVGENILAFLGAISLAIIDKDDRMASGVDVNDCWAGGISPGHWRDIVGKASAIFSSYDNHPLASEIQKLNISKQTKGFGKLVTAIITAKNDFKHDRGPSVPEDLIEASGTMQELLSNCLDQLSFLTDFPIRKVTSTNPNRSGDKVSIQSLLARGDHPGMPQESTSVPLTMETSRIRTGDFYISTGADQWIPLFPFMMGKMCQTCKVSEVYFPDRWFRNKNMVELKSFERGHTVVDAEAAEALQEWVGAND